MTRARHWLAAAVCAGAAWLQAPAQALIVAQDRFGGTVPTGAYSGVGLLLAGTAGGGLRPACTATLLSSGRHALTAAHCVSPALGQVRFETASGIETAAIVQSFLHPNALGDDVAVVELAAPVAAHVTRHDLYRGRDEIGQAFVKVGYGSQGSGAGGFVGTDFVNKRAGRNRFEMDFATLLAAPDLTEVGAALGPFAEGPLAYVPTHYLLHDFDSGLAQNDLFGLHFGLHDLGFGAEEIGTFNGDSGTPSLIGGAIAGLTVFGGSDFALFQGDTRADSLVLVAQTLEEARALFDNDALFDSFLAFFADFGVIDTLAAFNNLLATDGGFGEFSAELRISAVADWIDGIVGRPAGVPVPGALALVLLALSLATFTRSAAPAGSRPGPALEPDRA